MSDVELFKELKELLISQQHSPEDIAQVEKAYKFAKKTHEGQFRVSGEPYIIHPVEVAKILAGLEVDTHTLIAAFLHDILEDTDTKPETIENLFGTDVLNIVQGVTKLGKLQFKSKEERQAENFRRLFIAMANDIRVIFLKLADRLHNMRTLNFMTAPKQQKIARETLDIFAPLANRLGIYKIKAELEDYKAKLAKAEKDFSDYKASEELKAYKNTITADIDEEFKALVVGNTKEEVDASYAQVKGIQNAVKEKYKVKEPLPEPKSKAKAPQKTEDLLKRLNSMSLEEYAEARKNKFK